MNDLAPAQWASYERDGYLVLRDFLPADELAALNARLDELMAGTVQHPTLLMQLDPNAGAAVGAGAVTDDAAYDASNVSSAGQTPGFKGPSRAYRKIGEAESGLECDEVFMRTMRRPVFRRVCDRVYGAHAAVAVYRSMVMCKPAGDDGGGTPLPWHQDGGEHWALDRDPLLFAWIALTEATKVNGAVQVVPGSHRLGLLSRRGHTLSAADIDRVVGRGEVVDVELRAGDAFLCHNFTVHRSGINSTAAPRRGFSINYVDARTRVLNPLPALAGNLGTPGGSFTLVFPSPFS